MRAYGEHEKMINFERTGSGLCNSLVQLGEPTLTFVDLDDLDSALSSEMPAIEYVPDSLVRHKVCRVRFITEDLGREDGQPESEGHYNDWDEY